MKLLKVFYQKKTRSITLESAQVIFRNDMLSTCLELYISSLKLEERIQIG